MSKSIYPNISEIVTTTLRNRTGELSRRLQESNLLLERATMRPFSLHEHIEYVVNKFAEKYGGDGK